MPYILHTTEHGRFYSDDDATIQRGVGFVRARGGYLEYFGSFWLRKCPDTGKKLLKPELVDVNLAHVVYIERVPEGTWVIFEPGMVRKAYAKLSWWKKMFAEYMDEY